VFMEARLLSGEPRGQIHFSETGKHVLKNFIDTPETKPGDKKMQLKDGRERKHHTHTNENINHFHCYCPNHPHSQTAAPQVTSEHQSPFRMQNMM
jgi:hypothetical protein